MPGCPPLDRDRVCVERSLEMAGGGPGTDPDIDPQAILVQLRGTADAAGRVINADVPKGVAASKLRFLDRMRYCESRDVALAP